MRTLSTAALAALLLAGCAAGTSLSGNVTPAGVAGFGPTASAVQLSLVETGSGRVVASESLLIEGRPSVAFRLGPAPAEGAYELRARVVDRAGAVLYRAEEAVELPADGALNVTVEPGQVGG